MAILVVDDDVLNVKLLTFLLEEAGYEVIKAYNGQDALRAAIQHIPDLILLDVSMPMTSGFDICRQIRGTIDVPVIFLSAHSELEDRVTGLQIGAEDYIVKPFEPAELLARIEVVLRRYDSDTLNPSSRLIQGEVILDPVSRKVTLPGERLVSLTTMEFRLLYYLMKNAGRVLSSDQIMDKVWGSNYFSSSNQVAVYIRRVRSKIEPDMTNHRYIVTVPYFGYKFESQSSQALMPVQTASDNRQPSAVTHR
jgi:DNA-binding response OmpR family regulator